MTGSKLQYDPSHLRSVFVDRVIHLGENLRDQVKVRSPKMPQMEFNRRLNGVSVEEQVIAFVLLGLAHEHFGFPWPRSSLTSCSPVSYFRLVCFSFL